MATSSNIKVRKDLMFQKYLNAGYPCFWWHIHTLGLKLYKDYKIRTKIILGLQRRREVDYKVR